MKLILILLLSSIIFSCTPKGSFDKITIPSPSLQNSFFENEYGQETLIYLPPNYHKTAKKYPVVYFLPGFTTVVDEFIDYSYYGFNFEKTMNRLIKSKKIKEMIIVIPNGYIFTGGSFYVNSPITGNWEDFIINDVVNFIDKNYRTLTGRESRGISGLSMGGFGALNLAMHYPEKFSCVYALSPGLFAEDGLNKQGMFSDINQIAWTIQFLNQIPPKRIEAENYCRTVIDSLYHVREYQKAFSLAYGFSFSPADPFEQSTLIDYPFEKSGSMLLTDSTKLKNYYNGFGNWQEKVNRYRENFAQLTEIVIDYGKFDPLTWIPEGSQYLSVLLNENGINHKLLYNYGQHDDYLAQRITTIMLPMFSNKLKNAD